MRKSWLTFLIVCLALVLISIWLSPLFMGWSFYSYFFQTVKTGAMMPDLLAGAVAIWLTTVSILLFPIAISYLFFRRSMRNLLIISTALSVAMVAMYFASQPRNGQLFNPYTGTAMYRYHQTPGGQIEMFPLGYEYHPYSGDKLLKLTPEIIGEIEQRKREDQVKLRLEQQQREENEKAQAATALRDVEVRRQQAETQRLQEEKLQAEQAAEASAQKLRQEMEDLEAKRQQAEQVAIQARQTAEAEDLKLRKQLSEAEAKRAAAELAAAQARQELKSQVERARAAEVGQNTQQAQALAQPLGEIRDYIRVPPVINYNDDLPVSIRIPAGFANAVKSICKNDDDPHVLAGPGRGHFQGAALKRDNEGNYVGGFSVSGWFLSSGTYNSIQVFLCGQVIKETKVLRNR